MRISVNLEGGLHRMLTFYTLIATPKLSDTDPQAWLADVLARIANLPQHRLPELLPWAWQMLPRQTEAAA